MSYFSQTGNTATNIRHDQSTAPRVEEKEGVIFRVTDQSGFFIKKNFIDLKDSTKEELTPEEEDKFYKKVFKTSLI